MLRRSFVSAALALSASSLIAAPKCPLLIVGMDAAYPPFGSIESGTGAYVGFDVDIIKAIGKVEGFDVEIRNLAFDGLIPALKSGVIDVAINDITVTADRAQSVDFSDRYYIASLGAVVRKDYDAIKTADDLVGKKIAVSIGSTGEEAARKIPNADIRVFNQLNECYMELVNNGVDVVINDLPTNDFYVTNAGQGKVKSLELALTREDLAIAVRKGNKILLRRINRGLGKLKQSGEFTEIYMKWFGRKPPKDL